VLLELLNDRLVGENLADTTPNCASLPLTAKGTSLRTGAVIFIASNALGAAGVAEAVAATNAGVAAGAGVGAAGVSTGAGCCSAGEPSARTRTASARF
jgi:hypothetical protein